MLAHVSAVVANLFGQAKWLKNKTKTEKTANGNGYKINKRQVRQKAAKRAMKVRFERYTQIK